MNDDIIFAAEVFYDNAGVLIRPLERGKGFDLASYHRWCDPSCHPAIIKHISGISYILLTDHDEVFYVIDGSAVSPELTAKVLAGFGPNDILSAEFDVEAEWYNLINTYELIKIIDAEIIEDLRACSIPTPSEPPSNTSKLVLLSSEEYKDRPLKIKW